MAIGRYVRLLSVSGAIFSSAARSAPVDRHTTPSRTSSVNSLPRNADNSAELPNDQPTEDENEGEDAPADAPAWSASLSALGQDCLQAQPSVDEGYCDALHAGTDTDLPASLTVTATLGYDWGLGPWGADWALGLTSSLDAGYGANDPSLTLSGAYPAGDNADFNAVFGLAFPVSKTSQLEHRLLAASFSLGFARSVGPGTSFVSAFAQLSWFNAAADQVFDDFGEPMGFMARDRALFGLNASFDGGIGEAWRLGAMLDVERRLYDGMAPTWFTQLVPLQISRRVDGVLWQAAFGLVAEREHFALPWQKSVLLGAQYDL